MCAYYFFLFTTAPVRNKVWFCVSSVLGASSSAAQLDSKRE